MAAARFLCELLAPHAPLRGLQIELMHPAHEAVEIALDLPKLALDAIPLRHLPLVLLGDPAHLRFEPIALARRLSRLGIGPLALLSQIGTPLGGLGAALLRLLQLQREVPLELPHTVDV